ncbi:hypothetical protein ACLIA0_10200 [Bacillaceae bacterium W0354]
MRRACILIIWGIIFTRVHIRLDVIDVLADPIGYLFIFYGLGHLIQHHHLVARARNIAIVLCIAHIPHVFIPFESLQIHISSMWIFYNFTVQLVDLILFFYIFKIIIAILQDYNENELATRGNKIFLYYMSIFLATSFFQALALNLTSDIVLGVTIFLIIIGIIIQLILIGYLMNIRHIKLEQSNNNEGLT